MNLQCDQNIDCLVEHFWEVLKNVLDPEIGVNIVDLGMVYSIDVMKFEDSTNVVVEMTLTSPGCPLADVIAEDVKNAIVNTGYAKTVDVNFIFDPPWNMDMMTEEGKMQLGLL